MTGPHDTETRMHVTVGSGFSMCSSTAIGSFPLGTLPLKHFLNQLMMLLSVTGRF